jgi:unsaturated rhamnogalacturonyl hydrolase
MYNWKKMMIFRSFGLAIFSCTLFGSTRIQAQTSSQASAIAAAVMTTWKDSADDTTPRWTCDESLVWKGLEGLWYNTGNARYFKYIQHRVDRLEDKEGNIAAYQQDDYSLDNIPGGRILLLLYKVTNQEKYYKAATLLRQQLKDQPRTGEGKGSALPFYAEYASLFHEDTAFNDIARQFMTIEQHALDPKTGLRGPKIGLWGQAMGWYGMALVDALDYFPAGHPGRASLMAIFQRYAAAIQKVQDDSTGLWWNILDRRGAAGNYPEASASCMFVYTLAKGVRLGYLPATDLSAAKKGYEGILKKFFITDAGGQSALQGTVSVSGLEGEEKIVTNDPKGLGAFLLAADEMDQLPTLAVGKGRTVLLDTYFNNEHHKDNTGAMVRYHYTWNDQANSGFSLFGHVFRQYGMHTDTLPLAPTAQRLKKASVYIIVDPDNEKESPSPNYPSSKDIGSLHEWVNEGGVLVLMSNDSANAEFLHFNRLAERMGIHFNLDDYHQVTGNQYEMGAFTMPAQDAIFRTTHKIYMKELSTLRLKSPAKAYFTDGGKVIMAIARIGKGTVFAVGDPWFYNEYLDGRKLPAEYENFNAARDLVKWLILQARR